MKTSLSVIAILVNILSASIWCAPPRFVDLVKKSSRQDNGQKEMDSRRDINILKKLITLSIQELVDEDNFSPSILLHQSDSRKPIKKRGRYMGICMRKHLNSFIPFPCLRRGSFL